MEKRKQKRQSIFTVNPRDMETSKPTDRKFIAVKTVKLRKTVDLESEQISEIPQGSICSVSKQEDMNYFLSSIETNGSYMLTPDNSTLSGWTTVEADQNGLLELYDMSRYEEFTVIYRVNLRADIALTSSVIQVLEVDTDVKVVYTRGPRVFCISPAIGWTTLLKFDTIYLKRKTPLTFLREKSFRQQIHGNTDKVLKLCSCDHGKHILLASGSKNGQVLIFNGHTKKSVDVITHKKPSANRLEKEKVPSPITAIKFFTCYDQLFFISACENEINVWLIYETESSGEEDSFNVNSELLFNCDKLKKATSVTTWQSEEDDKMLTIVITDSSGQIYGITCNLKQITTNKIVDLSSNNIQFKSQSSIKKEDSILKGFKYKFKVEGVFGQNKSTVDAIKYSKIGNHDEWIVDVTTCLKIDAFADKIYNIISASTKVIAVWNPHNDVTYKSKEAIKDLEKSSEPLITMTHDESGEFTCVACVPSPDPLIITGGTKGNMAIWSCLTAQLLHVITCDSGITTLWPYIPYMKSDDSPYAQERQQHVINTVVYAGFDDGFVRSYQLWSREMIREHKTHHLRAITSVAGSYIDSSIGPQPVVFASSTSANNDITSWRLTGDEQLNEIIQTTANTGHFDSIKSVCAVHTGILKLDPVYISCSDDSTIRVFSAKTKKELAVGTCPGQITPLTGVACISEKKGDIMMLHIAACGKGGNVVLWDYQVGSTIKSYKLDRIITDRHTDTINCITIVKPFVSNGLCKPLVVTGSNDNTICAFYLLEAGNKILFKSELHSGAIMSVAAFAGNEFYSSFIVSGGNDAVINIFDIPCAPIDLAVSPKDSRYDVDTAVESLTIYSPKKRFLSPIVVAGTSDGSLLLFNNNYNDLCSFDSKIINLESPIHSVAICNRPSSIAYTTDEKFQHLYYSNDLENDYSDSDNGSENEVNDDGENNHEAEEGDEEHEDVEEGEGNEGRKSGESAVEATSENDDAVDDNNEEKVDSKSRWNTVRDVVTTETVLSLMSPEQQSCKRLLKYLIAVEDSALHMSVVENQYITYLEYVDKKEAAQAESSFFSFGDTSFSPLRSNEHKSNEVEPPPPSPVTEDTMNEAMDVHSQREAKLKEAREKEIYRLGALSVDAAMEETLIFAACEVMGDNNATTHTIFTIGINDVYGDYEKSAFITAMKSSFHSDTINSLAVTGYYTDVMVASGSDDNSLIVWNATTSMEACRLQKKNKAVNSLLILDTVLADVDREPNEQSQEDQEAAAGGKKASKKLDKKNKKKKKSDTDESEKTAYPDEVSYCDGRFVIAGGREDNKIYLWNLLSGTKYSEAKAAHSDSVNCIIQFVDGNHDIYIASGSEDKTIKIHLFGHTDGCIPCKYTLDVSASVIAMAYVKEQNSIAYITDDGGVWNWKLPDVIDDRITTEEFHEKVLIGYYFTGEAKCIMSYKHFILTGDEEGVISIWNCDHHISHDGQISQLELTPELAEELKSTAYEIVGNHGAANCISSYEQNGFFYIVSGANCGINRFVWNESKFPQFGTKGSGRSFVHEKYFSGHKGQVTALACFKACSGTSSLPSVFIVSGSEDRSVCLWNDGGEMVRMFSYHTAGVASVALVPSNKVLNPDLLIVSSDKSGEIKIWDSHLAVNNQMPTPRNVDRNYQENENFDVIKTLVKKYTAPRLFSENYPLFATAIHDSNEAFLNLFLKDSRCSLMLTLAEAKSVNQEKSVWDIFAKKETEEEKLENEEKRTEWLSLINLAIQSRERQSLAIVFSALTELLNEDPKEPFDQFYHASTFVDIWELQDTAHAYPIEFKNFIVSLSMVRAHPCTFAKSTEKEGFCFSLSPDEVIMRGFTSGMGTVWPDIQGSSKHRGTWFHRHNISAETDKEYQKCNVWFTEDYDAKGEKVIPMFLPLESPTSVYLLEQYVQVCERLNGDVSIFDSEVCMFSLRYAWQKSGKRVHVREYAIHLAFTGLFTLITFCLSSMQSQSNSLGNFGMFIQVIVLLFIPLFIFNEYKQYMASDEGIISHFSDAWNVNDAMIYSTVIVGSFGRFANNGDTDATRNCLAIASICIWLKVLYFLRAFGPTGPLVSMILNIANDMKFFLLMLGIVLTGFAEAFWIMSKGDHTMPFGTVSKAFLSSFDFMLGNSDSDFSGTSSKVLGTFLYVMFMIIVALLLLNLLIALMGESFSRVNEKGPAQFRYEQAKIILELDCVNWDKSNPPNSIHILKRATDFEENTENPTATLEDLLKLVNSLSEKVNALGERQDRVVVENK